MRSELLCYPSVGVGLFFFSLSLSFERCPELPRTVKNKAERCLDLNFSHTRTHSPDFTRKPEGTKWPRQASRSQKSGSVMEQSHLKGIVKPPGESLKKEFTTAAAGKKVFVPRFKTSLIIQMRSSGQILFFRKGLN